MARLTGRGLDLPVVQAGLLCQGDETQISLFRPRLKEYGAAHANEINSASRNLGDIALFHATVQTDLQTLAHGPYFRNLAQDVLYEAPAVVTWMNG